MIAAAPLRTAQATWPVEAKAQSGQDNTATADSAAPQGDDAPAIPIDEVPLPRPRPKFALQ